MSDRGWYAYLRRSSLSCLWQALVFFEFPWLGLKPYPPYMYMHTSHASTALLPSREPPPREATWTSWTTNFEGSEHQNIGHPTRAHP